jgi:hypothetical protein
MGNIFHFDLKEKTMYKISVHVCVKYIDEKGREFQDTASSDIGIETLRLHPIIADIIWMGIVPELRDRCEDRIAEQMDNCK